jgi:hypothetical protein
MVMKVKTAIAEPNIGEPQLEHGDLLAQSEDLQGYVASRTEENAECTQHSEEQLDHELTV